jgi:hypothetical protein
LTSNCASSSLQYADLLNPQPPAIPQLQAALDANTVLLYHAFAGDELLIVAVSRQAVRGYRVKVDPRTLENDLAAFQRNSLPSRRWSAQRRSGASCLRWGSGCTPRSSSLPSRR